MLQYNNIKNKYPDALLLFRVGDFYETFGEDAKIAAKILGIVLTKRGAGSESETALAGFPHHSLNTYLPKLVKAGRRVAICDQLEDPKLTKKIVKRGVTELITPGVSLNDEVLHSKSNNFLAALHFGKKQIGISFLDVSTGEFITSQGNKDYIDKLLQNFSPSEVLIQKNCKSNFIMHFGSQYYTFFLDDWIFQEDASNDMLTQHFKVRSLKGYGIDDLHEGIVASGVILHYLSETQHHKLEHISNIQRLVENDFVWMDRFTIRNLELYQANTPEAVTLLDVIDHTISPMGGRLLKRWLALPLKKIEDIKNRHDIVRFLIQNEQFLQFQNEQIDQISDLERLVSKVATGKINPREVVLLKNSLESLIPVKEKALESGHESLISLVQDIDPLEDLISKICATLEDDAPVHINKGNAIKDGVDSELDELRHISNSGKEYLDHIVTREIKRTQISSLKIAFFATVMTLIVGYPVAYAMARAPEEWRPTLMMLVILPFWTSFLIRVYAWIGILSTNGFLNQFLMGIGLISEPLTILNTNTAVYIGIIYTYVPFMILPIYAALDRLDSSLIEAAEDLGCSRFKAFWLITFPLSKNGVFAGCFLVFIPALGEFVIPSLLGGSSTLMIGKVLFEEFSSNRDWPVASAVAVVLLLILIVPIVLFQMNQQRAQEAEQ